MLTTDQLLALLADHGPDVVEFTTSPKNTDKFCEAICALGYVNHFGRGVIRAQEALRRNGNPEVEFTFDPSHVLASIGSKP